MRPIWKLALIIVFAVVTLGAWHMYRAKKDALKLTEDVQETQAFAAKGNSDAEAKLGGMYYYGYGVAQDYSQAVEWYRKAADQGNPKGEYGIGYMYDQGKGVQQDFAAAFRLFGQAADKGDRNAQCGLAAMYYKGRGVSQDRAKAAVLYRRSADQGLAHAEYDLGYMYFYGEGVPQDRTEARLLLRRAAEHGDERAKKLLGLKLKAWVVGFLAIQVMVGFSLAFRPLALNIWEPSEGAYGWRDWVSVGTGALFLFTAALSWYGYTHNLIWCWVNRVTGFQLLRWSLESLELALLYFVSFQKKPHPTEEPNEAL